MVGEADILDQIVVCRWRHDAARMPLDGLRRRAVTELEGTAGIEIPTTSMRAEALASVETIAALLTRLAA